MICPKCKKEELTIMADITISMPSKYYRDLTKDKLRKKEVELWGVNWADASWICPKCGLIRGK